jgi:hypothetical protein
MGLYLFHLRVNIIILNILPSLWCHHQLIILFMDNIWLILVVIEGLAIMVILAVLVALAVLAVLVVLAALVVLAVLVALVVLVVLAVLAVLVSPVAVQLKLTVTRDL